MESVLVSILFFTFVSALAGTLLGAIAGAVKRSMEAYNHVFLGSVTGGFLGMLPVLSVSLWIQLTVDVDSRDGYLVLPLVLLIFGFPLGILAGAAVGLRIYSNRS